jgi:hypothetical protein
MLDLIRIPLLIQGARAIVARVRELFDRVRPSSAPR